MHLGGKCKISWANDDLERFLKVRALCAMNLSGTRGPWQIGLSGGSKFFLLGGGVCFFHFSISNSECGTAHLSLLWSVVYSCCSRCAAFVSIIHVNDLLDDVKIYFLESNFSSMLFRVWHNPAQPFDICLVLLMQRICCLRQVHPPQWPLRLCNIPIFDQLEA